MTKSNSQNERSALDRMQSEPASDVLGYSADSKAANARQAVKTLQKMAAEGEATAEDLGNATIDNKYNSSEAK